MPGLSQKIGHIGCRIWRKRIEENTQCYQQRLEKFSKARSAFDGLRYFLYVRNELLGTLNCHKNYVLPAHLKELFCNSKEIICVKII